MLDFRRVLQSIVLFCLVIFEIMHHGAQAGLEFLILLLLHPKSRSAGVLHNASFHKVFGGEGLMTYFSS